MFSSLFKMLTLFAILAPVTQAAWALELEYTWSDRGYSRIIVREKNQTDPDGVRSIQLGETITFGPLERKDIYILEIHNGHKNDSIILEFTKEWNLSLSPNISRLGGVEIRHRAVCEQNFYGSDCDTFCETSVSHRCTEQGDKICFPGYEGADCTPVTTTTSTASTTTTTEKSSSPETTTEESKVWDEAHTEENEIVQVNRTVYGLLISAMVLLVLVLVAFCAVAFLRSKPYANEPLLPTHQQHLSSEDFITPPRLKLLSEMMGAKSEEIKAKAPKILSDRSNIMDSNNNEEVVHIRSELNQYSSPPSLRDSESGSLDRNTTAFSVVTLPEPMQPLETNHYASITSPDTPELSRTVREMVV